jgi:hypothetical protein
MRDVTVQQLIQELKSLRECVDEDTEVTSVTSKYHTWKFRRMFNRRLVRSTQNCKNNTWSVPQRSEFKWYLREWGTDWQGQESDPKKQ